MPSPTIILAILLALSVAANGILSKLYVSAKEDVARVQQAFDSFKAQVEVEGKKAQALADATRMADKLRKDTADAENAATVARLNTSISKLRHDADSASRNSLPPAPADSRRADLLCLDRAEYQRTYGEAVSRLRQGSRGLADEGSKNTLGLATGQKWARELH